MAAAAGQRHARHLEAAAEAVRQHHAQGKRRGGALGPRTLRCVQLGRLGQRPDKGGSLAVRAEAAAVAAAAGTPLGTPPHPVRVPLSLPALQTCRRQPGGLQYKDAWQLQGRGAVAAAVCRPPRGASGHEWLHRGVAGVAHRAGRRAAGARPQSHCLSHWVRGSTASAAARIHRSRQCAPGRRPSPLSAALPGAPPPPAAA